MIPAAEQVAYQARALAQAHSLTPLAQQFLNWAVARERTRQPTPEIGVWAGSALVKGYCVRQVEEEAMGRRYSIPQPWPEPDLEELGELTTEIAAAVRTGESETIELAADVLLGDEDNLLETLDRIVASEVENRLDHWRDSVTDDNWAELEEWITWWVVKGYALRVAEVRTGCLEKS